jgi:hypothetical protein
LIQSPNKSLFSRAVRSGLLRADGKPGSIAAFDRYATVDHYGPFDPETAGHTVCKLAAVRPPQAGPACVKEPVFIALGNRLDLDKLFRDPLARKIVALTADDYAAGLALARASASEIRVHTGTITAAPLPLALLYDVPERCAPPGPPVWTGPP